MKLLMLAWTTFNIPVVAAPCYGKFADCKNYIHRFVVFMKFASFYQSLTPREGGGGCCWSGGGGEVEGGVVVYLIQNITCTYTVICTWQPSPPLGVYLEHAAFLNAV